MSRKKTGDESRRQLTVSFQGCKVVDAKFAERKTRPGAMAFEFEMGIAFPPDGRAVLVRLTMSGHAAKATPELTEPSVPLKGRPLYLVTAECRFNVQGGESAPKDDRGCPIFPKSLMMTVINCTFGACRGMAVVKSEGTAFAEIVPPIMSVRAFLPSEFELEYDHGI